MSSRWDESTADILVDFAEAAVHALLHARSVYPHDIFERRRKYGVPVWMSRHPELNEYICQVLTQTKPLMLQGVVRKIIICMFDDGARHSQLPVERVVLDMHHGHGGEGGSHGIPSRHQHLLEVEDQLRSALLQIEKSSAHLPSRQGCTFALHVEASEDSSDDQESSLVRKALQEGKWVLGDQESGGRSDHGSGRQVVPIKSIHGTGFRVELLSEVANGLVP